jgi:hypothetical protein
MSPPRQNCCTVSSERLRFQRQIYDEMFQPASFRSGRPAIRQGEVGLILIAQEPTDHADRRWVEHRNWMQRIGVFSFIRPDVSPAPARPRMALDIPHYQQFLDRFPWQGRDLPTFCLVREMYIVFTPPIAKRLSLWCSGSRFGCPSTLGRLVVPLSPIVRKRAWTGTHPTEAELAGGVFLLESGLFWHY